MIFPLRPYYLVQSTYYILLFLFTISHSVFSVEYSQCSNNRAYIIHSIYILFYYGYYWCGYLTFTESTKHQELYWALYTYYFIWHKTFKKVLDIFNTRGYWNSETLSNLYKVTYMGLFVTLPTCLPRFYKIWVHSIKD